MNDAGRISMARRMARWFAVSALVSALGACATQPTIPEPSTLKAPAREIVVTERRLDVPHRVLGSVEATLGGLHESEIPGAVGAAMHHLRNAAYTKYGEPLDAVMGVRTSPVTTGGLFGARRGVRAEGVAIAVSVPTSPDASTLTRPTREIIVTERRLEAPHQVLGSIEATLGQLHESDLPGAVEVAKQHLRNVAFTKYGERLDAVMDVRTSPVTTGGLLGAGWAGETRGLRAEGVAIAISLPPADSPAELTLTEAGRAATDAVIGQLQKLPSFLGSVDKYGVVIDSMLEAPSGQQTAAARLLEQTVAERIRSHPRLALLPFQLERLREAHYLLTGTMRRVTDARPGTEGAFQINLALTELKTGIVVARASSRARDEGLDTSPTPYYRDSPILAKDEVVDGYITTAETPPGRPADPAYFGRVATASLISQALLAYNDERYRDALTLYRNAAATPAGEQLRVVNGIYLATWKLGQVAEAEEAFGHIVALGLRTNNLGVKFLFKPRTTEFWSDPLVSGPYNIWLRQIARQAATAKVCMTVMGHASRTGSEQYNDRLSQQRASYIKGRLETEAPSLAGSLRAAGMGFRENLIGTGTDDARDALDRRVEFKIAGC